MTDIHEATRHPASTTATEQPHGHPALTTATNLCGVLWMSLTTSERTHTVRPRKTWMQRGSPGGGSDRRTMSDGQVPVVVNIRGWLVLTSLEMLQCRDLRWWRRRTCRNRTGGSGHDRLS